MIFIQNKNKMKSETIQEPGPIIVGPESIARVLVWYGVFVFSLLFGMFTIVTSIAMLFNNGWDGIKQNCSVNLLYAVIIFDFFLIVIGCFNLKSKPSRGRLESPPLAQNEVRLTSAVCYIIFCIVECVLLLLYLIYRRNPTCSQYLKLNTDLLSPGNTFIYQLVLGGWGILTSAVMFNLALNSR